MSERKGRNGNMSAAPTAPPVLEQATTPLPEPSTPGRPELSPYPPPAERTGLNGSSLTRSLTIDTPITECPTNLDIHNPRERALLFAAGNPADYRIGAENSCIITAHHWLAYPDEREDPETGEVRQFATIVLFDKVGKFFKTTSAYAPRRLKAAIELFSAADWKNGITFVVTVRLSQQKRPYHDIRVLVDEMPTLPSD